MSTGAVRKQLIDVRDLSAHLESDYDGDLALIPAVSDEEAAQWVVTVIQPDGVASQRSLPGTSVAIGPRGSS